MGPLLTILILIASVLLVLVVLMQNPKGGGLSTDFGAPQQLGGVQKTNDFVEKATWSLAGIIAVLSIAMSLMYQKNNIEIPAEDENPQTETPGDIDATGPTGQGQ